MSTSAHLAVRGVSKAYGATQALDDASLQARRGTIHALLGGNGSGKSTLIKVLAGVESPDAGELTLAGIGHDLVGHSPADARALGLHFVHQQSSTFPDLTVAENLSIGRGFEVDPLGRVRWSAVRRRTAEVLERFEIEASPDAELSRLSGATQMMVAIARALQDEEQARDGVLVLDEPTASLTKHEVDLLLGALRRYADRGHTILYVTHRLEEVMSCADDGTVLRDGQVVSTFEPSRVTHDDLVTMIAGHALESQAPTRARAAVEGAPVLRGHGLGRGDASIELGPGEIVGIAGILGSGRTTLLRQIFGVVPLAEDGALEVDGREIVFRGPREAMRAGVAYVPDDRPQDAMFADMPISENLSVVRLGDHTRHGWVSARSERSAARSAVKDYDVRTASETALLSSLSGGNQQKVILARWLQRNPRVLLLDEPTQGVDVGARAEIHSIIRRAAEGGAGVLLVSSDFDELTAVCDRVLVLREGRIVAEASEQPLQEDSLNAMVYAKETA